MMKLPYFDPNSHKGEKGRVLIVAGSHKYYGAPIFNALAAEQAGADLITLFTSPEHTNTAKSYSLNLFLREFVHQDLGLKDIGFIMQESENNHVMLIGSGLGTDVDTAHAIDLILRDINIPAVIDGDALQKSLLDIKGKHHWTITPHRGEYKRVFGEEATPESVLKNAKKYKLCIVAKGPVDYISDGTELYENHTGCPQMRVGGTGDALAGIIASYIAQGLSAFEASKAACHYFGSLGSYMASEIQNITTLEMIHHYAGFCKSQGE